MPGQPGATQRPISNRQHEPESGWRMTTAAQGAEGLLHRV